MPVHMPFLARSLAVKLGLAVFVVAVGLSGAALLLLDVRGSAAVDRSTVDHMEVLLGALEGSFSVFDAQKNAHPVADILAEIGRHPEVDALQVFNAQGVIRHSLKPQEQGTQLTPAQLDRTAKSSSKEDLSIVRQFAPRTSCTGCHKDPGSLGGVRMVVDRERIQSSLFALRAQTGSTFAGIIGAVVLAVLVLARRIIIRPIRELVELMGTAESGDWLVRAPVRSQDELGALARAFNAMLAALTDMRAREVERSAEEHNTAAEQRFASQMEDKNRIIEAKNHELQQRVRDLSLVGEVGRALAGTLSLDEQLAAVTRVLSGTLGYPEFTIMLLDRPAALLRVAAAHGFPESMGVKEMTFTVGEGIAGLVAQSGETLLVPDTSSDTRYLKDKSRFTPEGSLLCVPLIHAGHVLGVINLFQARRDAFRKEEVELIQSIASLAALGFSNARLFQETVEQALTDVLTSTPNRRALDARLEMEVSRAQRFGQPVSVLMVDVDHFKHYNDTHGHMLGDVVLREVAQTMCRNVRKMDTVARYGGEEFCLILPNQDAGAAQEVAEKLRRAVHEHRFEHGSVQPNGALTVSIGVACFPDHGSDVKTVLDAADAALYVAKRAGRDRVHVAATTQSRGEV